MAPRASVNRAMRGIRHPIVAIALLLNQEGNKSRIIVGHYDANFQFPLSRADIPGRVKSIEISPFQRERAPTQPLALRDVSDLTIRRTEKNVFML